MTVNVDIQIFEDKVTACRHFENHNTFAIKIKSSFRKRQCLYTLERSRRSLKKLLWDPPRTLLTLHNTALMP